MKRRITAILLVLMLLFTAAIGSSCGNKHSAEPVETKTVTDCIGRTVEIPENPERVGVMYASVAHMMAMLDVEEKIVGCPKGVKMDVLMQMKWPEITETATPYQEGSINTEELVSIDADLVIIRYSTAEHKGEVEKLDDLGIPYIVVDYSTLEELETAIRVMGQVFNKEEEADAYIDFSHQTMNLVSERIVDVPESSWPEVYHSVNEAIRTDAVGDICGTIMNKAGVKDISIENGVESGGDKTLTTLEEIYKWDPDAFIANEYSVTDYILSDSKWQALTAVQEGKVYTLPVGATRWCHPGSIEPHMAVLAIAMQFYPERFIDIDLGQYTADYYKNYFGLELDEKTIKNILAGEGMRKSNDALR